MIGRTTRLGSGHSRRRLAAAAAAIVLAIGTAQAVDAGSAAAEPDALTLLIKGAIPPGADLRSVTVLAVPTDEQLRSAAIGTELDLIDVTAAAIVTDGHSFSVSFAPEEAPASTIDNEGVIFLSVMVDTDQGTFQANASVRAVVNANGSSMWADPLAPLAGTSAKVATARVGRLVLPISRATTSHTVRISRWTKLPDSKTRTNVSHRDEPNPPPGCSYTKQSQTVRSTTIGTTYPVGADAATMVVSSSSGASYGIAISLKSGGGWGAFAPSGSKFTRTGWGFQWADYTAARSYRKGVEYGLYVLSCARHCNKCQRQWIPTGETGGTGENRDIPRPDWGYCQPVSKGKWWREDDRGAAYTNDIGVDFIGLIGVDLSVNRQYNSTQKLLYTLKAARRMCGSNDWPATAGKVMSRQP